MSILHEIHTKEGGSTWGDSWISCICSYCEGSVKLHYGLNIPGSKTRNAWWVIKYWPHRYIRFTLSFLPKHKK